MTKQENFGSQINGDDVKQEQPPQTLDEWLSSELQNAGVSLEDYIDLFYTKNKDRLKDDDVKSALDFLYKKANEAEKERADTDRSDEEFITTKINEGWSPDWSGGDDFVWAEGVVQRLISKGEFNLRNEKVKLFQKYLKEGKEKLKKDSRLIEGTTEVEISSVAEKNPEQELRELKEKLTKKIIEESGLLMLVNLPDRIESLKKDNNINGYTGFTNSVRGDGNAVYGYKGFDAEHADRSHAFDIPGFGDDRSSIKSVNNNLDRAKINEMLDIRMEVKETTQEGKKYKMHNQVIVGGKEEKVIRFTYHIKSASSIDKGKGRWLDEFGRTGRTFTMTFLLSESTAKEVIDLLNKDVSYIRDVAVKGIIGASGEKNINKWNKLNKYEVLPNYKKWDAKESGGRMYVRVGGKNESWDDKNIRKVS